MKDYQGFKHNGSWYKGNSKAMRVSALYKINSLMVQRYAPTLFAGTFLPAFFLPSRRKHYLCPCNHSPLSP